MTSQLHDEFLAATLPSLDLVYNLARRIATDPARVDDLVQETYANAFQAWGKGRRPQKIEGWLATIVLNLGRSLWRKASTRLEQPVENIPEHARTTDVEEEALAALRRRTVHEALWELPEEQRIAVALMDLMGFTTPEIARITAAPRGTVLSRIHRGRKKLALLLEDTVTIHET
jgi:RNA polymerase sigma-70 factor (ECF subfamily)